MVEESAKCPVSGIYCSECGILHDPDLEYCPIIRFIEALEKMSDALEKQSEQEEWAWKFVLLHSTLFLLLNSTLENQLQVNFLA